MTSTQRTISRALADLPDLQGVRCEERDGRRSRSHERHSLGLISKWMRERVGTELSPRERERRETSATSLPFLSVVLR